VETIWTKLAAPHTVTETSLRNSSQERNFLLQRPGGETGPFGSIAGAETALTREFGRHVFEIAALLRVSRRICNYRVWVVGTTGIEPVTPTMSTQCVDGNCSEIPFGCASKVLIRSRSDHGYLGRFLGREVCNVTTS
jgi:hypothetical protein